MNEYNLILELPIRHLNEDVFEELVDQYADFHPAVSRSKVGWAEVTIGVRAESLSHAAAIALGPTDGVVSLTGMTSAEFDRRPVEEDRMPQLVSVSEMAERLHVSHHTIRERIDAGTIRAIRVGHGWALPLKPNVPVRGVGQPVT